MSEIVQGLDADLRERMASRHDPQRERDALNWLTTVAGVDEVDSSIPLQDALHDGLLLCQALQAILPTVKYNKRAKMPFLQMENIHTFLQGARTVGCPDYELFLTVDLYEAKNIPQVVDAIYSLSRNAHKYAPQLNLPLLGPKLAAQGRDTITYTAEQVYRDQQVMNTHQYGYAGGANASGIVFGKRRDIGGQNP
jgi:hypothetical protein